MACLGYRRLMDRLNQYRCECFVGSAEACDVHEGWLLTGCSAAGFVWLHGTSIGSRSGWRCMTPPLYRALATGQSGLSDRRDSSSRLYCLLTLDFLFFQQIDTPISFVGHTLVMLY